MAIIQSATDTFKSELLQGIHIFGTDTIRISLYSSSASIDAGTTVYDPLNEVVGTGYASGGSILSSVTVNSNQGVSWVSWTNPSWPGASFTARGALIYNASKANRAIAVIDFGTDRFFTALSNTIIFPVADRDNAIIRLGMPR